MSTNNASLPGAARLAEILPGAWRVRATNFPFWVTAQRRFPVFTYSLVSADPLVIADDVSWTTPDGATKHLLGTDRWTGDSFVWRGRGLKRLVRSEWMVVGASEDGNIAAIRVGRSSMTPAGIDVIERSGELITDTRAVVARSTAQFGFTPEDFASLTWFDRD
ncbi:MAG: hypothetical protein H7146_08430 [Burkholderiaceae bacterium]|nr:hypothetical protein [Microbacteriaceae bacterium]